MTAGILFLIIFLSVAFGAQAHAQSALLKVDMPVALESYRLARPAFTTNGLATDQGVEEFLRADAELLKLREPVPAAKIFAFSLQKEINLELGIK